MQSCGERAARPAGGAGAAASSGWVCGRWADFGQEGPASVRLLRPALWSSTVARTSPPEPSSGEAQTWRGLQDSSPLHQEQGILDPPPPGA
eukprot:11907702-Alexandrium_andersonii.AAC.1